MLNVCKSGKSPIIFLLLSRAWGFMQEVGRKIPAFSAIIKSYKLAVPSRAKQAHSKSCHCQCGAEDELKDKLGMGIK
jgi:hypothetical protein